MQVLYNSLPFKSVGKYIRKRNICALYNGTDGFEIHVRDHGDSKNKYNIKLFGPGETKNFLSVTFKAEIIKKIHACVQI